MKTIAAAVAAILLVLTASCGKDDAPALVEDALTAMNGLSSYRLEMGIGAEAAPIIVEFATPDRYRTLLAGDDRVYEAIIVGERAFSRQCTAVDQGCGDWVEDEAPPFIVLGPSPSYLPQWPLVALEMASDVKVLGTEELEGATTIHLRGSVNLIRAVLENQRRVLTAAGITSFGEECSVPTVGDDEPTCRDRTFEESLENQEPTLSFYDENPATIDVWLSPDDLFIRRIALTVPPHESGGQEGSVLLGYSRFNQVEIEPPF